ncbi:glycosyltransferase [Mangrovibacter sp. SLW1]
MPQPPFETGKRHVLVTLGTHLDWHKAEVTRAVAKLAQTLPDWVFHLTLGNPDAASMAHQSNLYCLPWVDYDRWIAEYDAVIHHGGAGIMWHCLKAERPALVYPVDYDQFDHAARLAWHGKGIWLKGGIHALEQAKPLLLYLVQSTVKNEK